jgi:hypothetical protein
MWKKASWAYFLFWKAGVIHKLSKNKKPVYDKKSVYCAPKSFSD